MSRRKHNPLRTLNEQEYQTLQQLSRSQSAPVAEVSRAKALLLVAQGHNYQDAAQAVGRRSGDAVAALVARFNQEGVESLTPRHGGGRKPLYDARARQRILDEAARTPDRERDGCATWSLSTLQKALRCAPDGLPHVSTYTLWQVLKADGQSHQNNRTWCETGTVVRVRKDGAVLVTDPDTDAKKN